MPRSTRTLGKKAGTLKLVEIHREDIESLPDLMALVRAAQNLRFIVFCDDLSFDTDDTSYKSLKAVLEGGIEGRPENVILYATSNRRHLLSRDMIENERSTAINPGEAVEEKVSLSDRFGLWLGFHRCSQDEFLAMVEGYVEHFKIKIDDEQLRKEALEWATTRGSRSGRVAWQYVQDRRGAAGREFGGHIKTMRGPKPAHRTPDLPTTTPPANTSSDRPATNPCEFRSAIAAHSPNRSRRTSR